MTNQRVERTSHPRRARRPLTRNVRRRNTNERDDEKPGACSWIEQFVLYHVVYGKTLQFPRFCSPNSCAHRLCSTEIALDWLCRKNDAI